MVVAVVAERHRLVAAAGAVDVARLMPAATMVGGARDFFGLERRG